MFVPRRNYLNLISMNLWRTLYVDIYVCIYIHVHAYTHIFMHVHIYVYLYMYTHARARAHTRTYIYMCVSMYMYVCVCNLVWSYFRASWLNTVLHELGTTRILYHPREWKIWIQNTLQVSSNWCSWGITNCKCYLLLWSPLLVLHMKQSIDSITVALYYTFSPIELSQECLIC